MTANDRGQSVANIKAIAEAELKEEQRRKSIDEMKEKLRSRKSWLNKLLPFKVVIVRRDKCQ